MNENFNPTEREENAPVVKSEDVTVGQWVVTILVSCIPIIGLIMMFVWAFGSGTNPSKANWAKANLVWTAVCFVFAFLFFVLVGVGAAACV